jgi:hypothetical protein
MFVICLHFHLDTHMKLAKCTKNIVGNLVEHTKSVIGNPMGTRISKANDANVHHLRLPSLGSIIL